MTRAVGTCECPRVSWRERESGVGDPTSLTLSIHSCQLRSLERLSFAAKLQKSLQFEIAWAWTEVLALGDFTLLRLERNR